jgi:hypothetical protein
LAAIAHPVALRSFAVPSASATTRLQAISNASAIIDSATDRLDDKLPIFQRKMEEALGDARRLRALGLRGDFTAMIHAIEAELHELKRNTLDLAEGVAAISTSLRAWSGWRGFLDRFRLRGTVTTARRAHGIAFQHLMLLNDFLEKLKAERDAPLPPPEEAPVNRAFDAYRNAFRRTLPRAAISDEALSISEIAGEILPVLTIQHPAPISGEARLAAESAAHAEVEALDPSLVGMLAFDHVSTDDSA